MSHKEQINLRELLKKICVDDISHPVLQELDSLILHLNPNLSQNERYNLICEFLLKIVEFSEDSESSD